MSQAARAHDPWADDLHTPPRRRRRVVDSWASAEELEVLGGLGRDPSATWTVLTLDRDDDVAVGRADVAATDGAVQYAEPQTESFWDADDEPILRQPTRRFRRSGSTRDAGAEDRASALRIVDHEAAPMGSLRGVDHEAAPIGSLRGVDHEAAPIGYVSEPPPPLLPGQRRTVVIRGRVPAPSAVAAPDRRRPAPRARDRVGHRPDRVALWAFVLGLMLILIAVLSAGG